MREREIWSSVAVLSLGCLAALWAFCPPALAAGVDAGHIGKVFSPVLHSIALEYAGTIEKVLVAPGDEVLEGQPLARYRLKDDSILSILDYLGLEQKIIDTQVEIANTEKTALGTKEEYDAARRLSAAQMGSAERLNRLKNTLALLQRQKKLLAQSMEADKKSLRVRRDILKRKLGKTVEGLNVPEVGELVSPLAGEVVYVHPSLREGMILEPMDAIVTVAMTNPMEVRTRVFEAEIPSLRIGGKAKVTVISLGDRSYDGEISSIDRRPDDMGVDRPSYYGVRIKIPNDDGKLRAGFKTTVSFAPEKGAP